MQRFWGRGKKKKKRERIRHFLLPSNRKKREDHSGEKKGGKILSSHVTRSRKRGRGEEKRGELGRFSKEGGRTGARERGREERGGGENVALALERRGK